MLEETLVENDSIGDVQPVVIDTLDSSKNLKSLGKWWWVSDDDADKGGVAKVPNIETKNKDSKENMWKNCSEGDENS